MDIVIFTVPAVLAISNSSFASISNRGPQMHLLYDEIFLLASPCAVKLYKEWPK